jgi:ribosome biogenesis GTPase
VREQLGGAFPEIAGRAADCRFGDCSHLNEPDCAVLEAVAGGEIDPERHRSYAKILEETSS